MYFHIDTFFVRRAVVFGYSQNFSEKTVRELAHAIPSYKDMLNEGSLMLQEQFRLGLSVRSRPPLYRGLETSFERLCFARQQAN